MGQTIYNDGSYEENTIAIVEGQKSLTILHKAKDNIIVKFDGEGKIILIVN